MRACPFVMVMKYADRLERDVNHEIQRQRWPPLCSQYLLAGMSGLSSLWLCRVNKDGICICRALCLCEVQCMTNGSTMVGSVVDQVKDGFLAGQHAAFPVHKLEANRLVQCISGEGVQVVLQPFG